LRNLDQLLKQVTQLISQRFGFYHVGIFLLDERSEYAVLRAANSEGGLRMLERNHMLKVGEVGIVGFVTQAGEPRIALDVGQDLNFSQNPDLPSTRSELCLPLLVGGKIIGALDVQSTQEAAFSEDDVTTLNVMAEQIAISIDNARLISESQAAIEAARRAYGEVSQASWKALLQQQIGDQGYLSVGQGDILPISGDAGPEYNRAIQTGEPVLANEGLTVYIPIKSRDLIIGAIRLDKPAKSDPWSADDLASANTLADQLSTSLDSARLFRDINRQAVKERAISEIASKISASINLENLFETAAREIGRTFPGTEVLVQLKED
jgi:GAF domain-containing protein